jgi:hypothetical protein
MHHLELRLIWWPAPLLLSLRTTLLGTVGTNRLLFVRHLCPPTLQLLLHAPRQALRVAGLQAVALVFEHVTVAGLPRPPKVAPASTSPPGDGGLGTPRHSGLLAEHGPANAALKLLDDLCMMATGKRCSLWCAVTSSHGPYLCSK